MTEGEPSCPPDDGEDEEDHPYSDLVVHHPILPHGEDGEDTP